MTLQILKEVNQPCARLEGDAFLKIICRKKVSLRRFIINLAINNLGSTICQVYLIIEQTIAELHWTLELIPIVNQ